MHTIGRAIRPHFADPVATYSENKIKKKIISEIMYTSRKKIFGAINQPRKLQNNNAAYHLNCLAMGSLKITVLFQ